MSLTDVEQMKACNFPISIDATPNVYSQEVLEKKIP